MAAPDQPSVLHKIEFAAIPGWRNTDLALSLAAFRRSCTEIIEEGRAFARKPEFGGTREDWLPVCQAAAGARDARGFFETHFTPLRVSDAARPEGLFTGYYEPEAAGSLKPGPRTPAALLAKPADLIAFDAAQTASSGFAYGRIVDGKAQGYFTRREIEEGALSGRGLELAYLESWVDLFFIHIQGSGRVRLTDGRMIRLAYAAKSGQPYTGTGRLLVERGVLAEQDMSMQAMRAWMREHPEAARELMWENKSYIFFREVDIDDPSLGPPGAQKVNLTPERSLAVDRNLWSYGMPVWLDTSAPKGPRQELEPFRALMIAQDTGTAIRGPVRGDVFWGAGEAAALTAGHMKSPGAMTVLLPKALAQRLTAAR